VPDPAPTPRQRLKPNSDLVPDDRGEVAGHGLARHWQLRVCERRLWVQRSGYWIESDAVSSKSWSCGEPGERSNEQAALKVLHVVATTRRKNREEMTGRTNGWKQILNALTVHYGDWITNNR
jgi:hypothetical protein